MSDPERRRALSGATTPSASQSPEPSAPHTFVDAVEGLDDLIAWSKSSSFGNFLSDLDPGEFQRGRARLSRKLEAARTRGGIPLERYLVFATARRP